MKIGKTIERAVIEAYRSFYNYTRLSSEIEITEDEISRFERVVEEFEKKWTNETEK